MEENIWKNMYLKLAGSVADAVELIQESQENNPAKRILIRAMQDAEDIYIGNGDPKEIEEMSETQETS